jgi:hypothetical protein
MFFLYSHVRFVFKTLTHVYRVILVDCWQTPHTSMDFNKNITLSEMLNKGLVWKFYACDEIIFVNILFKDVMIELYRRNIWKDAKTVNVITTACFSKVTKVCNCYFLNYWNIVYKFSLNCTCKLLLPLQNSNYCHYFAF